MYSICNINELSNKFCYQNIALALRESESSIDSKTGKVTYHDKEYELDYFYHNKKNIDKEIT